MALELRVRERGWQLDERERVTCGELEKPPPDRGVERNARRVGEQLSRFPRAQTCGLQTGQIDGLRFGQLSLSGGEQERDVKPRHAARDEQNRGA
jgi:hypothetical protein